MNNGGLVLPEAFAAIGDQRVFNSPAKEGNWRTARISECIAVTSNRISV
jgi:hypothetical protein